MYVAGSFLLRFVNNQIMHVCRNSLFIELFALKITCSHHVTQDVVQMHETLHSFTELYSYIASYACK